jgi:quercetin dioxygenase-like cupin family protein
MDARREVIDAPGAGPDSGPMATTSPRIHPGDRAENPVTGERFHFTSTAASSGGELLAFDFALRPGGAVPLAHVHPEQTETFAVHAGRMRFRVGLRTVEAGPGDVVAIPPGVPHSFANAGDEEARLSVEVRPALAMEEMFADVIEMANSGRLTTRGLPRNLLDLAELASAYDHEAHAPWLGRRLQHALLAPLVALGRLRRVASTDLVPAR